MLRYVLVILTLAAAAAFAVSIAVEARWIGGASPTPVRVAATTHSLPRTTATAASTQTTRAILAYYFADPSDVKVGPSGRVYVADTLNDRVVELGPKGTQFPSWGSHAVHPASMHHPQRVLPLKSGFYVIDDNTTRVTHFSSTGSIISRWTVDSTIGGLTGPTGMVRDTSGSVYMSDGNNDRIIRLDRRGHVVRSWSTRGFLASAEGGPNDPGFPGGIAIDHIGDVYVAYPNAGAVQKFSPQGVPIDKWQLPQRGAAASDVAVDSRGDVFVVDVGTARVTKFAPNGPLLTSWGGHGTGKSQLIHPTGLTVDGHNHVYVSDAGNRRLGSFIKEWSSEGKLLQIFAFG